MDCEAFRNDMLDALYGEGGEAAARRAEAHQLTCSDCRREMADLRRLRGDLAQWRLPETLRRPAEKAASPRRIPFAWAAAAAVLLAASATVFGGAELRRDQAGFSVRIGRRLDTQVLDEMDRRHRAELAALRAEIASARPPDQQQLLRTVAQMIGDSERRQEDARLDTVRTLRQRAETQRHYDLARMSAGLAYLDGKAGLQAARTTELVGHLLQASQKQDQP
jgi:hypothetical protein